MDFQEENPTDPITLPSIDPFDELEYLQTLPQSLNGTNGENPPNLTTPFNMTTDYCGETWQTMWESYHDAHIYLLISVGVAGCMTNILNILVFTRRLMQSPTNSILTALATTDFLFALFPLTFGLFFVDNKEWSPTHLHAILTVANEFIFLLFHTWSIYLTVVLGIWRCLGVLRPLHSRSWCTFKIARWVILLALIFGFSLVLIMHISVQVCEAGEGDKLRPTKDKGKIRFWRCQPRKWSTVRYWVHAVGIKIGPCIFLTLATLALIHGLLKANEQRRTLAPNLENEDDCTISGDRIRKSHLAEQKTNKMLVVVLLIFIMTEAPPGAFTFVAGLLGDQFFTECYRPAAYFWNLIEFISTTTSFFVYLTMSINFRRTFFNGFSGLLPQKSKCSNPSVITPTTQTTQL